MSLASSGPIFLRDHLFSLNSVSNRGCCRFEPIMFSGRYIYAPQKGKGGALDCMDPGGAFFFGSKEGFPVEPVPVHLLLEGYAVASINYRLSSEAVFPAQLEDCKAAVRWLRAHADEFGIDPNRIGVWGASAGGNLAALVGVNPTLVSPAAK
jgi:acetyl esterase/lipase